MSGFFPFDAVLFDLDGTLVATDRFWVQAARTGARRVLRELAIERVLPSAEEWMGLVGRPLDEGFATLFPDLEPALRARVQAACVAEEHRLLDAGSAAWMPGAEETLATLRAAGVRLGVASNCSQEYLAHMLEELGIGRYVDEARCLDSPGVTSKADMIEVLLERFGTRSAVFVGDRVVDRDAAWENGIPHVHCAFGFAGTDEPVSAQAVIEDLGELVPRLASRAAWLEELLERAGLFLPVRRPPFVVGVTGLPLAGASLFARDAARLLQHRGIPAGVAPLALWLERGADGGADPLEGLDRARLEAELLRPHAEGRPVRIEREGVDERGHPVELVVDVPAGAVLFLEGPYLLDPRFSGFLERTLWLETGDDEILRRSAGRDARHAGLEPLQRLRSRQLPSARAHAQRYAPERLADLVVDARNPLGWGEGPPAPAGGSSGPSLDAARDGRPPGP